MWDYRILRNMPKTLPKPYGSDKNDGRNDPPNRGETTHGRNDLGRNNPGPVSRFAGSFRPGSFRPWFRGGSFRP